MKKLIYTAGAVLVMLASASCKKNETVKEPQPSVEMEDMVFTATAANGSGLKTTIVDGTKAVWSSTDNLKVFTAEYAQGSVCGYKSGAGTAIAEFTGQCAKTGPWTAICPASSATGFSGGVITLTMPATQTYAANTFADGAMPCVAYSETNTFNFKHSFGVLKLSLKLKSGKTGSVKSITVTDKGGAKLNGTFTVNPQTGAAATYSTGGTSSVTLNCTSVALSESTATDFWIVVPQGAFEGGFDVTVTSTDDGIASLSTTKANTIKAGEVNKMPVQIIEFRPACQVALDADANWVEIGGQYWLKQNTKCIEYDTESEAFEASWLTDNTIPTSDGIASTPYYTASTTEGYGYYYNWAAAVGVADGEQQTTAFSGNRQGICPNGSHIPTRDEWNALKTFIETTKGSGKAGIHLKSNTADWNGKRDHLDTYGFAGLPAGRANGGSVSDVGNNTFFWTATTDEYYAYYRNLSYVSDILSESNNAKVVGRSVRCLRD